MVCRPKSKEFKWPCQYFHFVTRWIRRGWQGNLTNKSYLLSPCFVSGVHISIFRWSKSKQRCMTLWLSKTLWMSSSTILGSRPATRIFFLRKPSVHNPTQKSRNTSFRHYICLVFSERQYPHPSTSIFKCY